MKKPGWTELDKTLIYRARVFDFYSRRLRRESSGYEDDFYFLDCPDWANIIPLTANNEVVCIKQFRHGTLEFGVEIPGGIVARGEDPKEAVVRELEEETGYRAKEIISLGSIQPNPAIQNNRSHFFYATNVELTGKLALEDGEDLEVCLVPLSDIPRLIAEEKIIHGIMVAAFCRYFIQTGRI